MGKALTQQRGAKVGDAARWPRVRLGDVCEFRRGLTYSKKDEVALSRNVVLRSNNVDLITGKLDFSELKYISESFVVPPEKIVTRGTVLMCMANGSKSHLGKVALVDEDYGYAFGGFMGLIVPSTGVEPAYLYWLLCGHEFKRLIARLTDGTNINNLKFSDIADFEFPLPPLPVQHEIVVRLERELGAVDKLSKKFEELEAAAEAEFKAELKETFESGKLKVESGELGARRVKLGEVCDVLAGYAFKGDGFSDTGVPICGGLIISPERILWDECKYWPTSVGLEEYLLKKDDVVVALDRPWISNGFKVGLIRKADCPSLLIQRTARLRSGNKIDYRYLMLMLRDDRFREHCTTSGTTVPHISHKDIESYDIPLPSLPAQREVVARLDAAKAKKEKLVAAARRGRETVALMRKAILKEAFE